MANLIVILVIVAILGAAIGKIIIEKRKGVKCIGCPHSGTNEKKTGCSGGCNASYPENK